MEQRIFPRARHQFRRRQRKHYRNKAKLRLRRDRHRQAELDRLGIHTYILSRIFDINVINYCVGSVSFFSFSTFILGGELVECLCMYVCLCGWQ